MSSRPSWGRSDRSLGDGNGLRPRFPRGARLLRRRLAVGRGLFPRRRGLLALGRRLLSLLVELRGALHVDADHPRLAPRHQDVHDRMPAGLAPVLRPLDEAPLGEGERVRARRVVRAPDEPLPAGGVDDPELALRALVARRDEALLPDRRALRCDAEDLRLAAVDLLDHRGPALRARRLPAQDDPDLREGMRVPARGVPVAPEEPPPAAALQHDEGALPALVAWPDVVLLLQRGLDLLADRRLVLLEDLDDLLEHPLRLRDDLLLGPHAAGDLVHVLLEVRRHL